MAPLSKRETDIHNCDKEFCTAVTDKAKQNTVIGSAQSATGFTNPRHDCDTDMVLLRRFWHRGEDVLGLRRSL